jgi:hypothetical protein
MEQVKASTDLIERLLNDFDLSPTARQFVLSLRNWKDNRDLTSKQINALRYIEYNYSTSVRDLSAKWSEEKQKIAIVCANYYKENPPYFSDLSHRILNDKNFKPTEIEFNKLTKNKYAVKVLREHCAKPAYAKKTTVCLRAPAVRKLNMPDLKDRPLLVIKINAAPIISVAQGAKRYLVLPIGSDIPLLVEERDLKKYRIKY